MVDVGTGLTILGSAQVSKDLIARIRGPTADYLGDGIRDWSERGVANVQLVFEKAGEKLGPELSRSGAVPPRVLKAILEESQFAEDELMAEYLGGVLASARSEVGRDDRAAMLAATIGRLSTYAVRTHYLFYAAARPLFDGVDLRSSNDRREQPVFVAMTAYVEAMQLSEEEEAAFNDILSDTLFALTREDLLGPEWMVGDLAGLRGEGFDVQEDGIVFRLNNPGVILFCNAYGIRNDTLGRYPRTEGLPRLADLDVPNAQVVRQSMLGPLPAPPPRGHPGATVGPE
jgi:hypothetical protein